MTARKTRKSYWSKVLTSTPRDKEAVLSWLGPLCDGCTVESAELLCDVETDREKKLKVIVVDQDGTRKLAMRTFGRRFTVSLRPYGAAR